MDSIIALQKFIDEQKLVHLHLTLTGKAQEITVGEIAAEVLNFLRSPVVNDHRSI